MLTFILERRKELRLNPDDRATAVQTHGIGTTDNTNHLNRTTPLTPMPKSIIAIIKGNKK